MILSFRDQATEDFFHNLPTHRTARFPTNIHSTALRKLDVLNAAHRLTDLQMPPWLIIIRRWNHVTTRKSHPHPSG